jgi:lysophospholipase L1-like esterase
VTGARTVTTALRYVALGDSYTMGTAVEAAERWPVQLVAALAAAAVRLDLVANLASDGSTSGDVITRQLPRVAEHRPGFVSLLVGVNDVVQGVPATRYRRQVELLVEALGELVGSARILLVTTPDYTVTPAGADYGDPIERARGIQGVNGVLRQVAADRGIAVADVHDLSLRAGDDPALVAPDGLHPSGRQYASWVTERILPAALDLLGLPAPQDVARPARRQR